MRATLVSRRSREASRRRVVGVLVPGQAAVDGLAKQIAQRKLGIASGAGIAELSLDQRTHAEAFIEFAREQDAGIGGAGMWASSRVRWWLNGAHPLRVVPAALWAQARGLRFSR